MSKDFTNCVKNGGKVVTKKLKDGRHIKICYDKEGNSHRGGIQTKERSEVKAIEKTKTDPKSLLELRDFINDNYHI